MRTLVALAIVTAAFAADGGPDGKWAGVIVIEDAGSNSVIRTPVEMELSERGGTVDGKIGRKGDAERVAIRNGNVQGPNVTFVAGSAETVTPMRFSLKLDGDKMEGEMRGSVESGQIVAKVQFTREKE